MGLSRELGKNWVKGMDLYSKRPPLALNLIERQDSAKGETGIDSDIMQPLMWFLHQCL